MRASGPLLNLTGLSTTSLSIGATCGGGACVNGFSAHVGRAALDHVSVTVTTNTPPAPPPTTDGGWQTATTPVHVTSSDAVGISRIEVKAQAESPYDGELTLPAKALVQTLINDGAPWDPNGNLTEALPAAVAVTLDLGDHSRLSRPEVIRAHLSRINAGVGDDPAATIAACKELLESACKFVLEDYDVAYGSKDDLLGLYKKAAETLKLNAESVPDSAKGSQAAQRALRSMSTVVQAVAELRNELGLGHGRTAPSQALARPARLTAALTTGVVQFLLDTWHVRREGEVA